MSTTFSKSKRLKIAEKCNWHCAYCGLKLSHSTLVIDHVIPKYDGGSNDISNLLPSCISCNSTKGKKTLEQFRFFIEFRNAVPEMTFNQSQMEFLRQKGVLEQIGEFKKVKFFFEVGVLV